MDWIKEKVIDPVNKHVIKPTKDLAQKQVWDRVGEEDLRNRNGVLYNSIIQYPKDMLWQEEQQEDLRLGVFSKGTRKLRKLQK